MRDKFLLYKLHPGSPFRFYGGCVRYEHSDHVRRSLLHSVSPVSVRAGKAPYPQSPSSFPKRRTHGGPPFWFFAHKRGLSRFEAAPFVILLYGFCVQERLDLGALFVEHAAALVIAQQDIATAKRREQRRMHRLTQRAVPDVHIRIG